MTTKTKKPNAFAEVRNLHDSCDQKLKALGRPAIELTRPEVFARVENKDEVNRLVRLLCNDLKTYGAEKKSIYEEHKDWKGAPNTPTQHLEAFVVGNRYVELQEKIDTTALPISVQLTEILHDVLIPAEQPEEA